MFGSSIANFYGNQMFSFMNEKEKQNIPMQPVVNVTYSAVIETEALRTILGPP